jgi:hypothetical protein
MGYWLSWALQSFLQSFQANIRIMLYLKLGCHCFLTHPFQHIRWTAHYYSALQIMQTIYEGKLIIIHNAVAFVFILAALAFLYSIAMHCFCPIIFAQVWCY